MRHKYINYKLILVWSYQLKIKARFRYNKLTDLLSVLFEDACKSLEINCSTSKEFFMGGAKWDRKNRLDQLGKGV
jgi:hypothetical protein